MRDRLHHGALDVRGDTGVGDDGEAARLAGDLLDRACPPTSDCNRVPVGGEPPRNRRADPRATTGDEGDAAHARRSLTISWSSTV